MENNKDNTKYRVPQQPGKDWTVLGQGKSIDRTESDPAMLGRWTINYGYNSGKSYQRFLESLNNK